MLKTDFWARLGAPFFCRTRLAGEIEWRSTEAESKKPFLDCGPLSTPEFRSAFEEWQQAHAAHSAAREAAKMKAARDISLAATRRRLDLALARLDRLVASGPEGRQPSHAQVDALRSAGRL